MPRISIEAIKDENREERVYKTSYGLPIFNGDMNLKLKDFKEYFKISLPGFDKNDPKYGYLHKQFVHVASQFDFSLNHRMFSPKIRFSLISGNRFSRNLGLRVIGYSLKNNTYIT